MTRSAISPLVHLELRTTDPARACAFLEAMFGWRAEAIRVGGLAYLGIDLGARIDGGVVRLDDGSPSWVPYVEVDDISWATKRARMLGASVLSPSREGPVGWRSVLLAPAGGEVALWQPKR